MTPKTSPRPEKSRKALFTLAYLVSFELKRLLNNTEVQKLVDQKHIQKFKSYFLKSFEILIDHEKQNSNTPTEGEQKRVRYSACFSDLV